MRLSDSGHVLLPVNGALRLKKGSYHQYSCGVYSALCPVTVSVKFILVFIILTKFSLDMCALHGAIFCISTTQFVTNCACLTNNQTKFGVSWICYSVSFSKKAWQSHLWQSGLSGGVKTLTEINSVWSDLAYTILRHRIKITGLILCRSSSFCQYSWDPKRHELYDNSDVLLSCRSCKLWGRVSKDQTPSSSTSHRYLIGNLALTLPVHQVSYLGPLLETTNHCI